MKKLISIFAVVFVLVFSCIPAFAESQVIDGYAVHNVPFNESFEGVLTSSNSGSQLYSSSENKTYNTSSVASAPATSSKPLFTASSIIDMIPKNAWKSNNDTYKVSFPADNGHTGVSYTWTSESKPNKVYHQSVGLSSFALKANRKYRFTFTVYCPMRSKGTFDFYLSDRENTSVPVVQLFHNVASPNGGGNLWVGSRNVTIEYVCPNNISTLVPVVKADIYGLDFACYINNFTITDITTEDLDNSINQGVDRIEDAGSDEPPLDTDISAFSSAIETMNGWLDQLNDFADSIDSAGDTAKDYISKGTELFNGFMSVAPASVIALIAFGVVFLVIRKIVGR